MFFQNDRKYLQDFKMIYFCLHRDEEHILLNFLKHPAMQLLAVKASVFEPYNMIAVTSIGHGDDDAYLASTQQFRSLSWGGLDLLLLPRVGDQIYGCMNDSKE